MSDWRRKLGGRGLLLALINNKPWLIPFIYHIYSLQKTSIEELREILGLRTSVIKRGLWWLMKNNIVEKTGDKYMINREYIRYIDELILNYCITGKEYVLKIGSTYYVAIVKKTKITTYTVPEKILREFLNKKLENRTPKDLSAETGYPEKLVGRVMKLYEILDICRR